MYKLSLFDKFIISAPVYGFIRGILYNYDRTDNNKQILITDKILYTLSSTFFIIPTIIPCIYYDLRNIELYMKNQKDLMIQDWVTSKFYNKKMI
jgi:ABC-type multidrug transport system permease subunit